MFDKILVAIDSSECSLMALDYGIYLAKNLNAEFSIMHVIDSKYFNWVLVYDFSSYLGVNPQLHVEENLRKSLYKRGKTLIEAAEQRCNDSQIFPETFIEEGNVREVVCKKAHTVDLVIIGECGESKKDNSKFLGSNAEEISRGINKPLIIAPALHPKLSKILLAYDGSNYANDTLNVIKVLSNKLKFSLTILNVGDNEEGQLILQEAKKAIEPVNLTIDYICKNGDPEDEIVKYANREAIDLIAMGAYGNGRIIDLILGSTTEYVLRNSSVPVLLMR
ncbi:MAG: universal stress protein [Candidatus Coatesbacteria bacterium]|nr:universal stress protein [Candidatus Coatesbacteria bacterium]